MRHFLFSCIGFYFSLLNSYGLTAFESAVQNFFNEAPEQIIFENQENDRIDESRIYFNTAVEYKLSDDLSYLVVKVQRKPGPLNFLDLGALAEKASWVVLRKSGGHYYLPKREIENEIPSEIQSLIQMLDPKQEEGSSSEKFVRAFYHKSDWGRSSSSSPRVYGSVRKSSAMWRPSADEYYKGVSVETKNGVRSFGPAKMYRHRGLWVMELEGSREKVAYQRGALIKEMLNETAFYYYRDRIDRAIEQSLVVRDFEFTEGFIKYYVDHAIFDSLRSRLSSEDKEVLRAFSSATGLSQADVERTMVLPDASQWLLAKVYGKQSLYKGFFGSIPGLGCSSFFVPKERSHEGVLLARNLDYEGADYFDRNQVVVYVRPEVGSEDLAYINFSTLATPLGVLTAVNESGLMLAVHQLMVDSVSKKGTPLLSITDHIIRNAGSIDEAIEILGTYSQYAGTWRLVLASSKENRSVAVDMADDELVIHEMGSTTNSAVSERMQENEFSIGFNYFTDSQFRKQNLSQALVERRNLDLQGAVDLIAGNQFYNSPEGKWQRRDYYGVVSKKNNVQSLVLAPDQNIAYVAVPDMRYSLPTMGSYIPVSLNFSEDVRLQNKLLESQKSIRKSEAVDDHEQLSVAAYRQASILIGEYGDYDRALDLLDVAREQSPENSLYPLMQGFAYFSYASYRDENWKNLLTRGIQLLEDAEALGLTHYQQSLVYLYRARYEALVGNRQDAQAWANRIDLSLHAELSKAAEKLKRGRYSKKNLRSPLLDFTNADFFKF